MLMVRDLSLSARGMQRVRTLAPMHAEACRIADLFAAGNPAGVVLGLGIEIIVWSTPGISRMATSVSPSGRHCWAGIKLHPRSGCAGHRSGDWPRAPAAEQKAHATRDRWASIIPPLFLPD